MINFIYAVRSAVNHKFILIWCDRAKHFTYIFDMDGDGCGNDEIVFDFIGTKFKRKLQTGEFEMRSRWGV